MAQATELPRGWAWATVGDVGEYTNGLAFNADDWGTAGLPIIRIQNLTRTGAAFNYTCREVEARHHVRPGTLLVSWSATLDVFLWEGPAGVLNQHIFKVAPNGELVDERYLYYALKSVVREMRDGAHLHGSTMKHINRGPFLAHPLPLPRLPEQRRIVAKLDELLTSSRVAREALDAVPAQLEQYRQSVLAAAFRDLLDGTYPNHPLGSLITSGRTITYGVVQTGTPTPDGVPTVRCGDIKRFRVAVSALKRVAPSIEAQYPRTRLRGGEVLLAIRGSVGEVAVAPPNLAGANVSREVAVIPAREDVEAEYLMYLLASPVVAAAIDGRVKGVAQSGINIADLRSIEIPLPSRACQIEIADTIRGALTRVDRLTTRIVGSRSDLDVLERATLAKAFRGELVPQDPNDEPADVLLARLRAAPGGTAPAGRRRRATARP